MSRRITGFLLIALTVFLFSLVSCTETEKEKSTPPTADVESLPDMILFNASYTIGKPERTPLTMFASLITIYEENSHTILDSPSFVQNKTGSDEIELEGSCDRAESRNNSRVTLSGNVKIRRYTDNVTIECNEIVWEDEDRSLKTDGVVSLVYDDGARLTARGIRASLDSNVYEFDEILEGVFVAEN